jgi:N-acetylneuraminic acid mutarotase
MDEDARLHGRSCRPRVNSKIEQRMRNKKTQSLTIWALALGFHRFGRAIFQPPRVLSCRDDKACILLAPINDRDWFEIFTREAKMSVAYLFRPTAFSMRGLFRFHRASIIHFLMGLVFSANVQAQYGLWTTLPSMDIARGDAAGGVVNGVFYVAGGLLSNQYPLSSVEAYNPISNSWSEVVPMIYPQASGGGGVIGGKLYTVGSTRLQVFDPVSNQWAVKAQPPAASTTEAVGAIGQNLYVLGSMSSGNVVTQNTLQIYDSVADSWSLGQGSMPVTSTKFAAAVLDGLLYVMGGQTSSGSSSSLRVYDAASNTWSLRASMSVGRSFLSAVAADGFLYAVGGVDSLGHMLSSIERYDPGSNTWSAAPSMPTARALTDVAVIDNRLFVVGGMTAAGLSNRADAISLPPVQTVPEPESWSLALAGLGIAGLAIRRRS